MSLNDSKQTITLSLISHTNVGKTTLARTLLKKDIGVIRDDAHVTDTSEAYIMLETNNGFVLRLWDTPGFGNSAKLLKRLQNIPRPTGWFVNEVWDRIDDRANWCNQQALRNVREDADVVLYLVNAAENPIEAGYVDCEMQILDWLSKPVIVLLNQTGPPREAVVEAGEEKLWEDHLQRFEVVKYVMSLDAFARCRIQENILMKTIEGVLPFAKRNSFDEIWKAWAINNNSVFERSMDSLAGQITAACCDREHITQKSIWELAQYKVPIPGMSSDIKKEKEDAMKKLADRLEGEVKSSLDELIQLHQLKGNAAAEILKRLSSDYLSNKPVNEGVSAIVGGFFTGAISGVGADFLAGGLTFGGGAVVGGILGAVGAAGLTRGYNYFRGDNNSFIRWSLPLYQELFSSALLRYLAVAHFGRGRGEYTESEYPEFWKSSVLQIVHERQKEIKALWQAGKRETNTSRLTVQTKKLLTDMVQQLLKEFYSEAYHIDPTFK
ncbi:GTP-binding protein HSR1-related [Candidatus Scalindua japonica]|uniref:GTP-binding protein HSR1-related n=1 Tax=Candidatus Scalindua japonica TaxID=1284222 RepID=A0A286TU80_9BACT|nr:DUF3482 domain-containing protein [Candidatus Scalindua japonica]GAX59449.1 GTP-binding protein HSR1-related [Candidatus Scalindua japonica]